MTHDPENYNRLASCIDKASMGSCCNLLAGPDGLYVTYQLQSCCQVTLFAQHKAAQHKAALLQNAVPSLALKD